MPKSGGVAFRVPPDWAQADPGEGAGMKMYVDTARGLSEVEFRLHTDGLASFWPALARWLEG